MATVNSRLLELAAAYVGSDARDLPFSEHELVVGDDQAAHTAMALGRPPPVSGYDRLAPPQRLKIPA